MMQKSLPVLIIWFMVSLPKSLLANAPRLLSSNAEKTYFLENKGQIVDQHGNFREDIDFKISGTGINVFIGPGSIHYQWIKPENVSKRRNGSMFGTVHSVGPKATSYRLDVRVLGANQNAQLFAESKLPYYERYYLEHLGLQGTTVESYQKITYKDIYPNIDWVLYIRNNQLEYDFVVHPGGNVSDIQLQYLGATALALDEDGGLSATTPFGTIKEAAPYSFQQDGKEVASSFDLNDEGVLSFNIGVYEGLLTIDPLIEWATYYGGNGLFDSFGSARCDYSGNVYVCGITMSTNNIATIGSHQVALAGAQDAFLVKFNSSGTRLWSTYYGGTGPGADVEWGYDIICDTSNNVYLSGETGSTNGIATPGSHQDAFGGGNGSSGTDIFLVKFDSSGNRQWATYYGGEGNERGGFLAYSSGNLYLSGSTNSTTAIATPGSFQPSKAGSEDGFLVKFDLEGVRLWSTYFGGARDESSVSVSTDQYGYSYIAGSTRSDSGIATAGSHQSNRSGNRDLFLSKFDSDGIRLWGTYYGGTEDDYPGYTSVSCDPWGNIYLSGVTESSSGIATPGSHQDTYQGGKDGLLVKFNSTGERVWGTYFGGTGRDEAMVYCADSNTIFLTGLTSSSTDIATNNATQATLAGGPEDAFLARFGRQGEQQWGTYFGGSGYEAGFVTSDNRGNIYLAGVSNSVSGIATPGSFQDNYPGGLLFNPFLAKFCFEVPVTQISLQGVDSSCRYEEATYTAADIEGATDYLWTLPSGWTGSSNTNSISIWNNGNSGEISVRVVRCEDTSESISFPVYVFPPDPPEITVNGFQLGTLGAYHSYQWLLDGELIPGANNSTHTAVENGDYAVIVVNEKGCIDTSNIYTVENVGLEDMRTLSKQVRIFPNPASDRIFIYSPLEMIITLTTIEGKLVHRQTHKELDVSDYPSGIYLLRLSTADGRLIKTEKVVKTK